ncbi:MAG: efflux RND transporter permease subunit, partial [Bacteroidales bacterium]|nr:efflux RND transporter permease subunit [Bacteroidales bacterium]
PSEVIKRLRVKIDELNEFILPSDVKIVPFLDRTTLVDTTVRTVTENLLTGIVLVTLIVFLFLFNWRTTVITIVVMPMAFLFAIIMLRIQGLPANLISMGALNFGLLLEGTLVIVERVFVVLGEKTEILGDKRYGKIIKSGLIKRSAGSVAGYIFFAQMTTMVALIPIFSFQQVEGKMFAPLAFTLGWALLGSLILSLTFVPVACKMLLSKPIREKHNIISDAILKSNIWVYELATRYKRTTVIGFCILFAVCIVRFMHHGTEFIPKINEGAVYVRATLPNSISLEESVRLTQKMKIKLRQFDEVDFILTQTGRPNDGTDPTGFFNIEFHMELKPKREWKRKISQDDLIAELQDVLDVYPGIDFGFSQPIQDNVEENVAGVKSSLLVNVYGNDLFQMESLADEIANVVREVRGVEDVNVFRSVGLPELQIRLDEGRMARYGVSTADAQAVVEMAIGGAAVTTFYENERMFDVRVRFQEEYRNDETKIGNILIPTMEEGIQVPLKEIADIIFVTGPAFIYRQGSSRYVAVGFSVRGRDLGSTIAEAQERVETRLIASQQPENRIEWAGEFESMQRATKRLAKIVPITLLLILFLLYMNFGNVKDTMIATVAFPIAFVGGFLSIWATDTIFGISAGIGFCVLFGIEATNSILLVGIIKDNLRTIRDLKKAINIAVVSRVRPMLMIAILGSVGLLPAAISTGMGSEVQKPVAIIIVGGMLISVVLSIAVLPQVYYFAYKKKYLREKMAQRRK